MTDIQAGPYCIRVIGDTSRLNTELTSNEPEAGVYLIRLSITSIEDVVAPKIRLAWQQSTAGIDAVWHPGVEAKRTFPFGAGFRAHLASLAPVLSLFDSLGRNRLTFAASDALHPVEVSATVCEETAEFNCFIGLFSDASQVLQCNDCYQITLRLDCRDICYWEALDSVQHWWSLFPDYRPSEVPVKAKAPMYSTWYSFHQNLHADAIEEECRLAKGLGCEAIIVDDGWQTEDNTRGYTYCGDWEVAAMRIPEMKAHVERIHALGLSYILWFAAPFVGEKSRAFVTFREKTLTYSQQKGTAVLDPRFPEVREYLVSLYERAVESWNLDGLKLDFIDAFHADASSSPRKPGHDCASIPEAVDRLLVAVIERLRRLKPGILIEFRQTYIGPLMRKYGNMFRVGDCPNDGLRNRIGTLDLRLLSGSTAVHSDMLMWSPQESAAVAARQLINVIFAVPQISMRLAELPSDHLQMLRFWLNFCRQNRDVLLEGKLMPYAPELLYPLVVSECPAKRVMAFYHDFVGTIADEIPETLLVINGTLKDRVALEFENDTEFESVTVFNHLGCEQKLRLNQFSKGVHLIEIPSSGLAVFSRN